MSGSPIADSRSRVDIIGNADALIDIGRPDRAVDVLGSGLARWPDDARLLEGLVRALMVAGRRAESLATAERLAAVSPESWGALLWLSRAIRLSHRMPRQVLENAVPVAERAVEIAPLQPATHHELALALLDASPTRWRRDARSRLLRASAAAKRAISLAPNWVPAQLLASAVARRLGDKATAAFHAEQALELAPSNEGALQAVYETAAGIGRRRQIAARIAFTSPSDAATDLVVATHRASPRAVISLALLAVSGMVIADLATYGDFPQSSMLALWIAGPLAGLAAPGVLMVMRVNNLAGWPDEIRQVVLREEHGFRWYRRGTMAVLAVLPVLWLPASVEGGNAGIWAFATLYTGLLIGFGCRFKMPEAVRKWSETGRPSAA